MHFLYVYDILQAEVFRDVLNAPNTFVAAALSQTPLGKFTKLS